GPRHPGRAPRHGGGGGPRSAGECTAAGVRQEGDGLAALVGDHLVDAGPAPQRRGENAASAGCDDEVDGPERARQAFLQRRQRTRHPGRPEHSTRAEHEADSWAGSPGHRFRTHEHLPGPPPAPPPGAAFRAYLLVSHHGARYDPVRRPAGPAAIGDNPRPVSSRRWLAWPAPREGSGPGPAAVAGSAGSSCLSAAQAAICAREENPSLARMLATCRAAVAGLMKSSSAMDLLLRPSATSAATWRSRGVSVPGGAVATS